MVYLSEKRDQVVLGTAGSGKTLMAVHRALYLSNPGLSHGGKTLLVTYNRALAGYLRRVSGGVTEDRLEVRTYHKVATGYLASRNLFGGNVVLKGRLRDTVLREAINDVAAIFPGTEFLERPLEFFLDELDWISGHGYGEESAYYRARRAGRLAPLQLRQRQLVWAVRTAYTAKRAARGLRYDWWDLPTVMLQALEADPTERRFRHIVIDEGQDLPPEAIRSLSKLVRPGGTITFFADYAQQLYGQRTSYRSAGLNIAKAEQFRKNYRNSTDIARLAIATAALPHFTDSADLVEPDAAPAAGTPPTLYRAPDQATKLETIRARAQALGRTGTVAVLARTWPDARKYVTGLADTHALNENQELWTDEPGIYYGTYYAGKGMEFDAVILPEVEADLVPSAAQIAAFGQAEALERDARLLYVGITRARSELLASCVGEVTEVLPAPDSGYWLVTGTGVS